MPFFYTKYCKKIYDFNHNICYTINEYTKKEETMNKKIIAPIAAIVATTMCCVGTTFALFTDKASATVSITAGKVQVSTKIGDLKIYSASVEDTDQTHTVIPGSHDLGPFSADYFYVQQDDTFINGGTAQLDASSRLLSLTNVSPGDKVSFSLSVTNNSNVKILYRLVVNSEDVPGHEDSNLFQALKFNIDGYDYSGIESIATPWQLWTPSGSAEDMTKTISPIDIVVPITLGNEWQDNAAKIKFTFEAVQSNANVENQADYSDLINKVNKSMERQSLDYPTLALDLLDDDDVADLFQLDNLVWNDKYNLFGVNNNGTIDYGTSKFPTLLDENVWEFADEYLDNNQPVYLKGLLYSEDLVISNSLDVGENTLITKIEYTNSVNDKRVVIRTNSEATTLKLNDSSNSEIVHYGDCGIIESSVGMNSLYIEEHVNFVEAKLGHIVVDGKVDAMFTSAVSLSDVKVEGNVTHAHAATEASALSLNENDTIDAVIWDYDGDEETTSHHPWVPEGTNTIDVIKDQVAATAVNQHLDIEGEARILNVGYPTLAEAIEDAEPGDTVVLLKDITVSTKPTDSYTTSYLIDKDLLIDGAGFEIFASYSLSGGTNAFCIDGTNLNVEFKNLTVYGNLERAIQSWSDTDYLNLTVNNCYLEAYAYTLRINSCKEANVKIINGTIIKGWCALYAKGNGFSNYLIEDSYLGGTNYVTEASSNGFGTIVLEGIDAYNPSLDDYYGKNNRVDIVRSVIIAIRTNGNTQEWINLNYGLRDSIVNVDDTTIIANGTGEDISREIGCSMAYDYWTKSYQANCQIIFDGTPWLIDGKYTLLSGDNEICIGTLNEGMNKANNGDIIFVESNTLEKILNVNVNVGLITFNYDAEDTTYNGNMEIEGYTVLSENYGDPIIIDGYPYQQVAHYNIPNGNILEGKVVAGTYYFEFESLVHDGYHMVDNGNGTWTVVPNA